ncbi:glycosyltransferase family 4 protein [Tomitella fengzijianii]|uniref:Glycosyltransferase family 4 protein n=1 Tax=Tomitella fengzijianii TaxID=2597660 RepID=A0A516X970_9ACTN|nr:glycosyltransferase family 4 protein [Tomitella fengzijianii]QDQ99221.1 glycosyltransferase family 4 protein [Tomitella fengzijianii]
MSIGMICPYSFDVPGGVQAHVSELAQVFLARGHHVSVLAPASESVQLPPYVVSAGRAVAIPYNGSVARLRFGVGTYARIRRWIRDNDFDVLHVHEPNAPSLSMLALKVAEGPIVATFHTSTTRSLVLATFQGVLRPYHEKISGRIAVSELARRWQVQALGADAVEIPNGVDVSAFAGAPMLDGYPRRGGTVLFLGRYDEPRKGMGVLLDALPALVERHPDLQVLVVGRGDEAELRARAGRLAGHLRLLGQVGDEEKASAMRSADVYVAPNLGGESFGIVLVEALSAHTPVVASSLDAFRRVLRDGEAGVLTEIGDPRSLAAGIDRVLTDTALRERLVAVGDRVVRGYDWPVVADQILRVYETVMVGDRRVRAVGE